MTDYFRKIRAKRRALFWEPEAERARMKGKAKAGRSMRPDGPEIADKSADKSANKFADKPADNFSDKSAEKIDRRCKAAGEERAARIVRPAESAQYCDMRESDGTAASSETIDSVRAFGSGGGSGSGGDSGSGNGFETGDSSGTVKASGMMEASEEIGVLDSFAIYAPFGTTSSTADPADPADPMAGREEAIDEAVNEALDETVDEAIDEDAFDFRRQYSEEAYRNFFERFETNAHKRYAYRFVKRSFDIIISFTALILLSPLFVVVAVAVKVDSKGPVFFTHLRMGRGGKPFKCYKFRSMRVEAPRDRAKGDFSDRELYLTRVGRLLRRLSIDELPQLFCCLVGTMSLIGPRPVVLTETELIEDRRALGAYSLRPGLSGYAQVRCRDEVQGKNKAILDAIYVKNACPWLDGKLMFLTLGCVISRRGNSSEPVCCRKPAGL